ETDQSSRSEEPTSKHLEEAHDKGQFAQTPEVAVFMVLAAAWGVIATSSQGIASRVSHYTIHLFSSLGSIDLTQNSVPTMSAEVLQLCLVCLGPVFGACLLAAILAGGLQSGFRLTPKVIQWKPERLNPIKGFEQNFGKGAWVRLGFDLFKFVAVAGVLYGCVTVLLTDPIFHFMMPTGYILDFIMTSSSRFFTRLLAVLGTVASISYLYQRWKTQQDLKMTREEVKEERKLSDASPEIKMAQRKMARRIMQKQMLGAVPLSDVIVTNPTHYAIALKYERGKDSAPRVVAKGENLLAKRIIEIANTHGVPRVENKPVARVLYKICKVGDSIPSELYHVIAEILAYVYKTHRYYFHRLKARRWEFDSIR
ncbi:MAG TPA: EscU/YscU/HrcU family type III secretion system export apparatus switch protein, partial [Opitutales bacterium]|nr:EscU/YscU/HrcU family type III secretion system export apparatus switch protein [Opitutales bacterium]